jgi:hypothetical protein
MGQLLTTESVLMCPHGGSVTIVSTNMATMADGAPVVRSSDTFIVAGCPFVVGVVPMPCVSVQWILASLASTVMGDSVLTMDSVGLCLGASMAPQGPVVIVDTQVPVSGT